MKKYILFIVVAPFLIACGQPSVGDFIRSNPPYSYDTYENGSALKWWINAAEVQSLAEDFYSDTSSDVSFYEAIDAIQNATWSDWERVWYNFNNYYATVLRLNGDYYICPFGSEYIFVSYENISEVLQWLDAVYGKLCEIEGKMWEAGVSSVSKDISIPHLSGLYYFNPSYSSKAQEIYSLSITNADVDLSQRTREINIELTYRLPYSSQATSFRVNETVYNHAYSILGEHEYMKTCLEEVRAYKSKEAGFANSVY